MTKINKSEEPASASNALNADDVQTNGIVNANGSDSGELIDSPSKQVTKRSTKLERRIRTRNYQGIEIEGNVHLPKVANETSGESKNDTSLAETNKNLEYPVVTSEVINSNKIIVDKMKSKGSKRRIIDDELPGPSTRGASSNLDVIADELEAGTPSTEENHNSINENQCLSSSEEMSDEDLVPRKKPKRSRSICSIS